MKKKFAICLDNSSKEQDQEFLDFVKTNGLWWWHWLSNSWLLIDPNGKYTAASIRDELLKIYPGTNLVVIEMTDDNKDWAGFGPSTDDRNMFKWFHDNW